MWFCWWINLSTICIATVWGRESGFSSISFTLVLLCWLVWYNFWFTLLWDQGSLSLPSGNRKAIRENIRLHLLKVPSVLHWIQENVTGFCRCFQRVRRVFFVTHSDVMISIVMYNSSSCHMTCNMSKKVSLFPCKTRICCYNHCP